MTPIERLLAIEEIKVLRARWCRYVDERRWERIESLLAPDAVLDLSAATSGLRSVDGANAIRAFVESRYGADPKLVHLNMMPEIDIHSETEASAVWRQESYVGAHRQSTVGIGYGTVHDQYVRPAGQWLIKRIQLTMDVIL
jgi:hypothetical protein